MSDDIETLRAFLHYADITPARQQPAIAAFERLVAERDSLRKALDDRHAADKKAWRAIMRASGRDRKLPDNKEVIAFYVADNERFEKERDSLRAKLEKAMSVLFFYRDEWEASVTEHRSPTNELRDDAGFKASIAISELSADAPAQPDIVFFDGSVAFRNGPVAIKNGDTLVVVSNGDGTFDGHVAPAQPPQISDEARSLLDEAIAALEPFAEAATDLDDAFRDTSDIWEHSSAMSLTGGDLRRAATTLEKLLAARNG